MNILTIDIGGNNVKLLATGQTERRKFPSGRTLTPLQMVEGVKQLTADWKYDVISIGYPGRVVWDRPVTEPRNLAPGWIAFDYPKAFGCPVKMTNDADMQALGSYQGGTMLFLGFGTGLGSSLVVRGHIVSMELGRLSYQDRAIEDFLGRRGLEKFGKKKWRDGVDRTIRRLVSALLVDDVVIGGGNAKKLKELPPHCRLGSNDNAFIGGYRLWEPAENRAVLAAMIPGNGHTRPEPARPAGAGARI